MYHRKTKLFYYLPTIGICMFFLLYIVASLFYPGGSQINPHSNGFSWVNNYWCNLLDDVALNGAHNPAKPFAVIALLILCLSITCFWINLNKYFIEVNRTIVFFVQIFGVISMIISSTLFLPLNHGLVTISAGFVGLISLLGLLYLLRRESLLNYFTIGLINVVLMAVNYFIYLSKDFIIYLPLIQKFTFLLLLFWFAKLNLFLVKEKNKVH